MVDMETGRNFFHNPSTGQSSWNRPIELVKAISSDVLNRWKLSMDSNNENESKNNININNKLSKSSNKVENVVKEVKMSLLSAKEKREQKRKQDESTERLSRKHTSPLRRLSELREARERRQKMIEKREKRENQERKQNGVAFSPINFLNPPGIADSLAFGLFICSDNNKESIVEKDIQSNKIKNDEGELFSYQRFLNIPKNRGLICLRFIRPLRNKRN